MAFRCMNCNGNMVFDVASQQMLCQHCGSTVPPESFRVRDTSPQSGFSGGGGASNECRYCGANLDGPVGFCPYCGGENPVPQSGGPAGAEASALAHYTCQNCGAELESTEESMIGMCPYCGGQSMLQTGESAIQVERLIPFQVTKEKCGEGYRDFAKKIPYLPAELKKPEFLQSFTGIYMPYYTYDVALGKSSIKGEKTVERHSSYEVVNTYQIDANVEGEYCGIPYDASRYLDDEISARTLPFKTQLERPFHPAYLSGFYADAATVEAGTYYTDAADQASQDVVEAVSDMVYQSDKIKVDKASSSVEAQVQAHHPVLFPLWFLTWRKGERVAYAVVNGESGKVVSDLPVDMRAFALGCGVISLILFGILELFFQPTPLITSIMSLAASLLMALALRSSAKTVYEKQVHANDKGWTAGEASKDQPQKKKSKKLPTMLLTLLVVFGASAVYETRSVNMVKYIVLAAAVLVAIVTCGNVMTWQKDIKEKDPVIAALVLVATVVLNALIVIVSPVNDFWYYLGDLICILGLVAAAVGMLRTYNVGTTRPLPKLFDRNEVV